ncbi:MAG: hypothetical protein LN414_02655, partial [Candidatus Thermoplasmatota archaeon]|nr:hypothetical protein [Candidatus Thermoplasmatota archaeon]
IEFLIDSPLNGATVEGNTIDVQGWGETGLRYRPSGTGNDGWRTVDAEGNFSITLTLATFAQNNFVFEIEDPAGNEASHPYNLNRVGMTAEPETDDPTLLIAVILLILAVIVALLFWNARKGGVEG